MESGKRSLLFVNKKKQKNFTHQNVGWIFLCTAL